MSDDDKSLDPQAARAVAQVRRLMLVASATTFLAVAVVLGVIGYRLLHAEGSARGVSEASAALPAGAKVIATSIGEGRLAVTIEVNGATEVRLFDLATLKPVGTIGPKAP